MKYDLMIVGAGVLGTFHAYSAAQKGLKVLLVEKDSKPIQATVRNFGQVIPSGMTQDLQTTALRSLEIYSQLQEKVDISARKNGSWYIASDDQEMKILEEMAACNMNSGCQSEIHDTLQTLAVNPALRKEYVKGSLFFPEEFSVNPLKMIYSVIDYIVQELKVDYLPNTKIIAIENKSNEVHCRDSAGETYIATKAVICNGHDYQSLFPKRFLESDLELVKLQMMRTQPLSTVKLQGNILSGRSIRRYESFKNCPSWGGNKQNGDLEKYGIHILLKQEIDGSIIIGDSHEYSDIDKAANLSFKMNQSINQLMINEAQKIAQFPSWDMAEYWAGYYSQHKSEHFYKDDIDGNIHFFTAIGGKGMTLGPGISEKNISEII